jgi:hypothetical protein
MTIEEFNEKFTTHFESLCYQDQLELGLRVCKALFFDYAQFLETSGCKGNTNDLLDAIIALQQYSAEMPDHRRLENSLQEVKELKQHITDFEVCYGLEDSLATNCAYEACEAVSYTLGFLLDDISDFIGCATTCLLKNVYAKVMNKEDLSDEEQECHPKVMEAKLFLLGQGNEANNIPLIEAHS